MTKYFVWIETFTGVQGQIWHDEPLESRNKPAFITKLSMADESLPLEVLQIKFLEQRP